MELKMKMRIKDLVLLSKYWLVYFAGNKKFGHSQLGAYFFPLGFFAKTLIGHLQLHLPCLGNS